MKTIYLSATELKRNTAEILNSVAYAGDVVVIERFGEPVAKMTPVLERTRLSGKEILNKYFGAAPDFPDVTKLRRSRKKSLSL